MKVAIGVLIAIWLICGIAGAWRLGELDRYHWRDIARGPFTLAEAFNENPVTYPSSGS